MEIVSNIALITINETLFVQVVSFLIFLFFINRIMIRPLQETMRERDSYFRDTQSSIRESEQNLAEMHQQLLKNEASAIKEADRQREALMDAGSGQAERILAEAKTEIYRLRGENMNEVDRQISDARKSLVKESEKLALNIMERILDREVSRGHETN